MNMLKKIYSEGDDEMKRTINKAWAESQDKKARGDEFDFWVYLLATIELHFLTYMPFLYNFFFTLTLMLAKMAEYSY